MDITDVRIKLVRNSPERLKAFCTITFDGEFVVRDIKLVDGMNGMFVAMPSRKVTLPCPGCRHKNHLRARYCEDCGKRLPHHAPTPNDDGRTKFYTDVAHPITPAFREKLQSCVIEAFEAASKDAEAAEEEIEVREEPQGGREEREGVREEPEGVREEPEEVREDEPLREAAKGDDYRSLIADLKGGRGDRPRETSEEAGRSGPPERKRRRGRGGQSGRDRGSAPQSGSAAERSDRPESGERPQEHRRADVAASSRAPKKEKFDESPDDATVTAETAEAKADVVSVDEAIAEPSTMQDNLEDTAVFGVGIN